MTRTNLSLVATLIFLFLVNPDCQRTPEKVLSGDNTPIFPRGEAAPAEFFTGTAWVTGLVKPDSVFTTAAGSVLFEPGARSNWHLHPCGQILLVTAGVGYHQIKGQAIEIIRKGDVIRCPPDVLHWHGASRDSSMSHIYLLPNTEKGMVVWQEPVSDEDYANLNSPKSR